MASKYHSHKVINEDGVFDSRKEYKRWKELKLMERAGRISDLERQVRIEVLPAQREPDTVGKRGGKIKGKLIERKVSYVADFKYWDCDADDYVYEDVKGVRTKEYILKRKLLLCRYGIRIKET